MTEEEVNDFLLPTGDAFPREQIFNIKKQLLQSNITTSSLATLDLKQPSTAFIFNRFLGAFGIDEFYIGNVILGILKLMTCGGFGIWCIVNLFVIMDETRRKNVEKLNLLLGSDSMIL